MNLRPKRNEGGGRLRIEGTILEGTLFFYDLDNNQFDVWSELSPVYKQLFQLENSEATGCNLHRCLLVL